MPGGVRISPNDRPLVAMGESSNSFPPGEHDSNVVDDHALGSNAKGSNEQYLDAYTISLQYTSLGVLGPGNKLRLACTRLATWKFFDQFILLLILVNCVFLALYDPLKGDNEGRNRILNEAEDVFQALFTFELLVKVVALGFVRHEGAYLRDGWNVLDFLVVMLGFLAYLPSVGNYSSIRAIRVLRPLRTISRLKGMRVLVKSLLQALPLLFDMFFLWAFSFLIFGLFGLQLFLGVLKRRCVDDETGLVVDEEQICSNSDGGFHCAAGQTCQSGFDNPNFDITSFDDIGVAFLAIFQVVTLEGWTDIMFSLKDATHGSVVIYFVVVVAFGAFFMVNLALAVISSKFKGQAEEEHLNDDYPGSPTGGAVPGPAGLSKSESMGDVNQLNNRDRTQVNIYSQKDENGDDLIPQHQALINSQPKTLWMKLVRACLIISTSTLFTRFITFLIIINTVFLATEHHNMSQSLIDFLETANIVLTSLFAAELVIKLIALRETFVDAKFNIFDAIVVIVSFIEIGFSGSGSVSALRAFRLLRVFKIARSWTSLRNLLSVITSSLPSFSNLMVLILLFMFIFSLLGLQLFGGKFEIDGEVPRAHFNNFPWAIVTVFQVLTGENWNDVMYSGVVATRTKYSAIYFVGLIIIGSYILLNLFLAILLTNFQQTLERERREKEANKSQNPRARITFVPRRRGSDGSGSSTRSIMSIRNLPFWNREKSAKDQDSRESLDVRARSPGSFGSLSQHDSRESMQVVERRRSMSHNRSKRMSRDGMISLALSQPIEPSNVARSPVPEQSGDDDDLVPDPVVVVVDKRASGASAGPAVSGAGTTASRSGESLPVPVVEPDDQSVGAAPVGAAAPTVVIAPSAGAVAAVAAASASASAADAAGVAPAGAGVSGGERSAIAIPEQPRVAPPLARRGGEGSSSEASEARSQRSAASLASQRSVSQRSVAASVSSQIDLAAPKTVPVRTLFLFQPETVIRQMAEKTLSHPHFDHTVFFLIFLSSVLLAIDEPDVRPGSTLGTIIYYSDLVLTILFTLEMTIKVVSLGLVLHQESYLRDAWNVLDFSIVVVSLVALSLGSSQLKALRGLRALRALRPLRLISRNEGLKIVVISLFRVFPAVGTVTMVGLLFWMIFGILGIQFFAGALYSCNDDNVRIQEQCVGLFVDVELGELVQRRWTNNPTNFDNIFQAMLALFELSTMEGWPDVLYAAVDSTGVGKQPERDHNTHVAWFFVLFILIGSFFMVNLFVGVVIDNFNRIKEEFSGSAFLTDSQKKWVESMRSIVISAPERRARAPEHPAREWMFNVVTHAWFDALIMVLITLNIVIMATEHEGQDGAFDDFLWWGNAVFTVAFLMEALLKMFGLGVSQYFHNNWNVFDFVIVVGAVIGFFFPVGPGASIFRVFRLARVFRIIRRARGLRVLFKTLMFSLISLVNVGALLLLLFFIYAVIGMNFFADVIEGDTLGANLNFRTFLESLTTVFVLSTGEAWTGMMHDCQVQPPDCSRELQNCGESWAPAFFVSFEILGSFILLNMFIAVILENFELVLNEEGSVITDEHYLMFNQAWALFDPTATRHIQTEDLIPLVSKVDPPLGLGSNKSRREAVRFIRELDLVDRNGRFEYQETLKALAYRVQGAELPDDVVRRLVKAPKRNKGQRQKRSRTKRSAVQAAAEDSDEDKVHSTAEIWAATVIQAAYRGHRTRSFGEAVRQVLAERNRSSSIASRRRSKSEGTQSNMNSARSYNKSPRQESTGKDKDAIIEKNEVEGGEEGGV